MHMPYRRHLSNIVLPIALIAILASGLLPAVSAAPGGNQLFRVLNIEDGDTLSVEMDGKAQRIQLLGIDAPEDLANPKLQRDRQRTGLDTDSLIAIGQAATRHLKSLVAPGQTVKLEGDLRKRDKYGRIPAIAYDQKGRALNVAMVEDGYAVILDRYPLDADFGDRLRYHEKNAIAEERGLWGTHRAAAVAWSGRDLGVD
jgi:micrococcal nuclease